MAEETEQFDLFEPDDKEQRGRVRLRQSIDRHGHTEFATSLRLDDRTFRNQLDRRKREDKANSHWKLSEDAVWKAFFSDRRLREELLAICGEEIADVEAVDPEDALRDVQAMAMAGEFGNAGRERVISLIRRVKKGRRR